VNRQLIPGCPFFFLQKTLKKKDLLSAGLSELSFSVLMLTRATRTTVSAFLTWLMLARIIIGQQNLSRQFELACLGVNTN
jgi:hypothetical protein